MVAPLGERVCCSASKWHMNRSAAPFCLLGARNHQQDLLNGPANRKPVIQDENAGHLLSCGYSFIGIVRHGGAIVGQDNAVFVGSPG
jgi:hypothetical protein